MFQKFAIPAAIILAGVLIGGAVYFSDNSSEQDTALPDAQVREAKTEEKDSEPPEFRPVDATRDHIYGSEDAPITLIEYSDFMCPFCAEIHSTLEQLVDEYDGQVRWVYRHAPVLGPTSTMCAEASECAAAQGDFWEYADVLYANMGSNDGTRCFLENHANDLGLDGQELRACVTDNRYADRVAEDLADARAVGLRGTPHTLIVGPAGQVIEMRGAQPIEAFKQNIDALLQN